MGTVQLSDRQAALVRNIVVLGKDVRAAGVDAGYSEASAYQALKTPAVASAIHAALHFDLVTILAPQAFRVAKSLMLCDKVSDRVRADIAFKFMDRAGYITPSSKEKPQDKQISEMTRDEMLAYIERNEREIQKIEDELAARATDVSEGVAKQPGAVIEAKPLSFLD